MSLANVRFYQNENGEFRLVEATMGLPEPLEIVGNRNSFRYLYPNVLKHRVDSFHSFKFSFGVYVRP